MKNIIVRRLHRVLGAGGAGFLLLAAVTGLLWAYAPYLYWQEGYLEKKNVSPLPPAASVKITVLEALSKTFPGGIEQDVRQIILRPDAGRWLYEIQYGKGKNPQAILIDAQDGKMLSPLNTKLAVDFAKQYVSGAKEPELIEILKEFVHRSGKRYNDVAKVRFRENHGTTIFLDRNSGRILEEEDRIRRFHFMVIRLHQLNFFGSKKRLTAIPGGLLILMIVSGLWMWSGYRKARMKKLPVPMMVQKDITSANEAILKMEVSKHE